ncbi:hypothetical protein IHE44_0000044, partial [Lamprotornis superbus]
VDADDVITKEEQIFLLLKAKAKCERHLKAKVPKVHGKMENVPAARLSVLPGSAVGKPGEGKAARPGFARPGFARPGFARPSFAKPSFAKPCFAKPCFAKPCFAKPSFAKPSFATCPPGAFGNTSEGPEKSHFSFDSTPPVFHQETSSHILCCSFVPSPLAQLTPR